MNVWQKEAVATLEVAAKAPPKVPLPRLHRGTSLWDGVHIAKSATDRLRVFQQRYQVYTGTRGKDYPGADHKAGIIRDAADDDAILVYSVSAEGEVLSSLRIALMTASEIQTQSLIPAFIASHSECSIRFGLAAFLARMCSSSRTGKDLLRLMMFAYYFGLTNDIQYAFLSARYEFRKLYERLGYQRLGPYEVDQPIGGLFLFGANLTDYARFASVGSPYVSMLDIINPRARLSGFGNIKEMKAPK